MNNDLPEEDETGEEDLAEDIEEDEEIGEESLKDKEEEECKQNQSVKHFVDGEYARIPLLDLFMIVGTALYFLAYYVIPEFQTFIDYNITHIYATMDLFVLFNLIVIAPYVLYWVGLGLRVFKYFWYAHEAYEARVYFQIFRINFCLFAVISIIFCLISGLPFLGWILFVGLGGIALLNITRVLRKYYKRIWKEEKQKYDVDIKANKITITINVYQILALMGTGVFFIFYAGVPALESWTNGIWNQIILDLPLLVIVVIFLSFTILFFAVDFLATVVYSAIRSHMTGIMRIIKIIFLIAFFYFIAKVVIYNLPLVMDMSTQTYASIGVSLASTYLSRNSRNMIDWVEKRRTGENPNANKN
jgi:hypothetical protein